MICRCIPYSPLEFRTKMIININDSERCNSEESTRCEASSDNDEFDRFHAETGENQRNISTYLYFSAILACMVTSVELGSFVVWIAPVAEKLLSDDATVNPLGSSITTVQLSTIGALPTLSFVFGTLILGKASDLIGRKNALIILSTPVLLMELILAFSTNIYMIYIPLSIAGFCLGGLQVAGRVYLSEISEDHYRTKMICLGVLGVPFGNVLSFLISASISSFKVFTLARTTPLMLSLMCLIIFVPETPVYLVARKRYEAAIAALKKLRSKDTNGVYTELKTIRFILAKTSESRNAGLRSIISNKAIRTAFFTCLGIRIIASTNGAAPIMSYLVIIFDEAGTTVPTNLSTILLTVAQVIFSFVATKTSDRYERRTLLLASILGNASSLFSIGLFFYLKSEGFTYIEYISWWPILGLIIFYLSNSLGIASIGWVVPSEVFPSDVISMAMSLLIFIDGLAVTLTIFMFSIVVDAFGMQWNFWCYSLTSAIGYFFVYSKVPETKDKTLLQIQAIFDR